MRVMLPEEAVSARTCDGRASPIGGRRLIPSSPSMLRFEDMAIHCLLQCRAGRFVDPRKDPVMPHAQTSAAAIAARDARAAESLAFADAALALAGHQVTDPVLIEITERAAREEITSEEAVAAIRRHVVG
ncbi:hypothetical protein BEH62_13455 [Clavibacter michiganensis subsp. insidiosus]|nr:hypothetical protein BEH62_13455 [Clavibacter michiganensis subsp. insidiosus]